MPRIKIIVADELKAHDAQIRSYRLHRPIQRELRRHRDVWLRRQEGAVVAESVPPGTPVGDPSVVKVIQSIRPVGTQHDEIPSRPNPFACPNVKCGACGHVTHDTEAGEPCDQCGSTMTTAVPNCRNCGDPEHAKACRAAGHCPDCGTNHGIAPDRIVAANGYRFEVEE